MYIGFLKRFLRRHIVTLEMLLVLSLFSLAWQTAHGQAIPQPPLRIAVVDVSKLLDEAPQSRAASVALQNKFAKREEELVVREKQLKDDKNALERNQQVSDAERVRQGRELRERRRAHTRDLEDFREELDIARSEALDRVQRQVLEAIEFVAKENSIDVVDENFIYASKRVNMTPLVLRYLEDIFKQQQSSNTPADAKSDQVPNNTIKADIRIVTEEEALNQTPQTPADNSGDN